MRQAYGQPMRGFSDGRNLTRRIRPLDACDFFFGQLKIQRREGIEQLRNLSGTEDCGAYDGFAQHPGERDLRPTSAALARDLADGIYDGSVRALVLSVLGGAIGIGLDAAGRCSRCDRQPAARKGAPSHHAHTPVAAERMHLALFLAHEQVVLILHGNERRPMVEITDVLHLGELPRDSP